MPASVTAVPWSRVAAQVAPQSIAAGEELTVPLPDPALVTVSARRTRLNVAVTCFADVIATTHSFAPFTESQPDHCAGWVFAPGVAVSVIEAPCSRRPSQGPRRGR